MKKLMPLRILAILLVLSWLFDGYPMPVQAEQEGNTIVHVVAWGETLFSISAKYDVSVDSVTEANQLSKPDSIYAGQQLIIPSASVIATAELPLISETHIVQAGENLYRISLQYNVRMGILLRANNLDSADDLSAGQVLIIPDSVQNIASPEEVVSGMHVVQTGDTLFGIARDYAVPLIELKTLNNIINGDTLFVGQAIKLPGSQFSESPGYTPEAVKIKHIVKTGETLSSIAARYATSDWVIAQTNNISNPSFVYVGQALIIPQGESVSTTQTEAVENRADNSKLIIVDISEQRTYVYENNTLLWTFVSSTGLPGVDTWRGDFEIQTKLPMAYASTWQIQMPNWLGFYWAGPLQNGFHALPILSSGQRLWDGLLGQPASYGCVVLSQSDSETLYNWAEIGTRVTVRD